MASDVELFDAWRRGERGAGEELFERHYEAVARFFLNKVGDDGPDLIQRTFLACVEGKLRFRGDSEFRSYLFSIAYKMLCKHYDARRREGENVDYTAVSVAELGPSPTGLMAVADEQRLLLAALRQLPLDLQVILELHYWEALTAEEAAAITGVPLGTAKTRIRRGRLLLRERIEALGGSQALVESTLGNLQQWAQGVGALVRRPA
jgi:RNA polymerase sigma-70 factor (ECF subfamily)